MDREAYLPAINPFSTHSPGMRENSRILSVTMVIPKKASKPGWNEETVKIFAYPALWRKYSRILVIYSPIGGAKSPKLRGL